MDDKDAPAWYTDICGLLRRAERMRMNTTNRQMLKKVLNMTLIVGTFAGVLFFALRSGDIGQIWAALTGMDMRWLLGALACFGVHLFFEGFIPYVFFRFQKVAVHVGTGTLVGLIGMYYSSITPAATGGQPMQVYALKKRGVPPGVSSSALTVKFFCWQCAMLLIGAVLWAMNPALVRSKMSGGVWFLLTGFLVNGLTVVGVLLLAVSRGILRALIVFFVNLAAKLHIVKDKAKTASRFDAAVNDFHASVELLTKHPFQFLVMFTMSLIQVTGLMSAIYFVYRGLGLGGAPYMHLLTMQTMLYIAASFTPLPGASGAQEGGFYLFLGSFFPDNIVFAAMFVWRFVTYYMSILAGFVGVMVDSARKAPPKVGSLPGDKTNEGEGR